MFGFKAGGDRVELKRTKDRLAYEQAATAATQKYREIEAKLNTLTQEIAHETDIAQAKAAADATAAGAEHKRLLNAYRSAGRSCPSTDSSSTPAGAASDPADDVRTDVFRRVDEVAGELAAALDSSIIAHSACEKWADEVIRTR